MAHNVPGLYVVLVCYAPKLIEKLPFGFVLFLKPRPNYYKLKNKSKMNQKTKIEPGDWFEDENGYHVTVMAVADGWCMVREGNKKPYVLPEGFVLATFDYNEEKEFFEKIFPTDKSKDDA